MTTFRVPPRELDALLQDGRAYVALSDVSAWLTLIAEANDGLKADAGEIVRLIRRAVEETTTR